MKYEGSYMIAQAKRPTGEPPTSEDVNTIIHGFTAMVADSMSKGQMPVAVFPLVLPPVILGQPDQYFLVAMFAREVES